MFVMATLIKPDYLKINFSKPFDPKVLDQYTYKRV